MRLFLAALVLLPLAAQAQDPFARFVTPEATAAARQLAIQNITQGDCGDGPASCAPATEAELAEPPISMTMADAAMQTGLVSALMQWCALDWEARSFLPFMVFHRDMMDMNERQQTLMGLVHGIQQQRIHGTTRPRRCPRGASVCPPRSRRSRGTPAGC